MTKTIGFDGGENQSEALVAAGARTAIGTSNVYSGSIDTVIEKKLRKDDTLIVVSLGSMASSRQDLLRRLTAIAAKGARLKILSDGDVWADTTDADARRVLHAFLNGIAQFAGAIGSSRPQIAKGSDQ